MWLAGVSNFSPIGGTSEDWFEATLRSSARGGRRDWRSHRRATYTDDPRSHRVALRGPPTVAAQMRPEFGWITGNLCDLSKGYFATTFLSSSLTFAGHHRCMQIKLSGRAAADLDRAAPARAVQTGIDGGRYDDAEKIVQLRSGPKTDWQERSPRDGAHQRIGGSMSR